MLGCEVEWEVQDIGPGSDEGEGWMPRPCSFLLTVSSRCHRFLLKFVRRRLTQEGGVNTSGSHRLFKPHRQELAIIPIFQFGQRCR